jgi:carbonic anhydrase/acetyltransferase-like protein (isoleucine patch superfamily)
MNMREAAFITAFAGHSPTIAEDAFVDPFVRLIGRVTIEGGASVWPGSVLRADDDSLLVGAGAAVLDLCLLEAPEGFPVRIGERALISHKACVHGATVEAGALVGIGAIVLDGAVVGADALIGAGAVVPPGTVVPPGVLMLGQPARVQRDLTAEEKQRCKDQVATVAAKAAEYLRQR